MPHTEATGVADAVIEADDWIDIGTPGKLATLVKKYVKHLGKELYFELM